MLKGLQFWYGMASIFFRAASKQPLKLNLPKAVHLKPYLLKYCIKTVPQKPPLYKTFDRFTGPEYTQFKYLKMF